MERVNGRLKTIFLTFAPFKFMHCILQTLHDLMDESELKRLSPSVENPVPPAGRKQRHLEENMRREAEERQKKKNELMLREQEIEKVGKLLKNLSGV